MMMNQGGPNPNFAPLAPEERVKKREKVVKILTSILIASKEGVAVEKIQKEYREMEGQNIPYRPLGHSSLAEFLDHGHDFCRISYARDGSIVLRGIPSESNAHIAHMVSKQRSASRKKPAKGPMRRPASRSGGGGGWMPPGGGGGGMRARMGGGGANLYMQQQGRRLGAMSQHRSGGGGGGGGRGGPSRGMTSMGGQFRHPPAVSQQPRPANVQSNGWGAAPPPQRRPPAAAQPSASNSQAKGPQNSAASVDPKNKAELLRLCESHRLEPPEFKTAPFNKKFVSVVIVAGQRYQTFPSEYNTLEMAEAAAAKLALDGLRKQMPKMIDGAGDSPANNSNSQGAASKSPALAATSPVTSRPPATGGLPSGQSASTSRPTSSGDAELRQIEDKVLALVGDRTNGVWSTQIDVEFKRKHGGQQLPANWARMLMEAPGGSSKLKVDSPLEGRYIITPAPKTSSSQAQQGQEAQEKSAIISTPVPKQQQEQRAHQQRQLVNNRMSSQPCQTTTVPMPTGSSGSSAISNGPVNAKPRQAGRRPPTLNLPPDTDFWNVYITNVNSSTSVFLRLLGEEYSAQYENLVTEMEMHYFNENDFPSVLQPQIGHIYAVKYDGVWHRVEVVDVSGVYITVFFIDYGEKEVVTSDHVKELKEEFFKLPPQAFSVSLAGLESFAESASALSVIQNELNGKSLVAEVYSRSGTAVSLLLIDTFTEKDINVNEKLCEQLTLPPLEEGSGEARSEGSGSSAVTPLPANAIAATAKATVTPTASLDRQMSPRDNGATSGDGAYSLQPLQADLPDELASMKELVPPPVPPVGSYFDVNVTLSANPSNFTVQSWSEGSALEQLQVEMNRHYSEPSRRTAVTRENLQEDKYFVARHSDGFWYRVRVNSQLDECTVAVRFVDYGDYSMIAMENLCLLASRFRNLPMQAINASLADIIPVDGDWGAQDTVWFSNRVVDKQFVTVIKSRVRDEDEGVVRVGVSLIDTTHPTVDMYVEKELVDAGKAAFLCV